MDDNEKHNKKNVCVVTFPERGMVQISNLLKILNSLFDDIYIITHPRFSEKYKMKIQGLSVVPIEINYKKEKNAFMRILRYVSWQLIATKSIINLQKTIDTVVLFIGGHGLILPALIAKILRKKTVLILPGSDIAIMQSRDERFAKIISLLSVGTYLCSDVIVVYSPNLIKEWNLWKYKNKTKLAREHFLEFDKFRLKKEFAKRDSLIGYVGRLSEEKGILNFIEAIPKIIEKEKNLKFLIVGDGHLRENLEKQIKSKHLKGKVKLVGWVSHDELPDYLNELKLVVLPSYTEGLPNVILEAMACGTPVLANSVGSIPDLIINGKTGFLMEKNDPESIAENVIKSINNPDLLKISKKAYHTIRKNFSYENTIKLWKRVLENDDNQ